MRSLQYYPHLPIALPLGIPEAIPQLKILVTSYQIPVCEIGRT
jgi:hypothetical protein